MQTITMQNIKAGTHVTMQLKLFSNLYTKFQFSVLPENKALVAHTFVFKESLTYFVAAHL